VAATGAGTGTGTGTWAGAGAGATGAGVMGEGEVAAQWAAQGLSGVQSEGQYEPFGFESSEDVKLNCSCGQLGHLVHQGHPGLGGVRGGTVRGRSHEGVRGSASDVPSGDKGAGKWGGPTVGAMGMGRRRGRGGGGGGGGRGGRGRRTTGCRGAGAHRARAPGCTHQAPQYGRARAGSASR